MIRRLVFAVLAVSIPFIIASAAEVVEIRSFNDNARSGPVVDELELDEIFYLERYGGSADYYLSSGSVGDTLCVVFEPLAPCSIYFADLNWFSSGSVQAFIWEYSDEAAELFPLGQGPDRETTSVSPLGEVLAGPINVDADPGVYFHNLINQGDLPDSAIWREDRSLFVVGFVKTSDDGLPQPFADDVSHLRFSYTWFCGPWLEPEHNWGCYSSDIENGTVIEMMLRVGVSYPFGTPPIISDMSQIPNTAVIDRDFVVTASIEDDNGWNGDIATLRVLNDNGDTLSFTMTDDDEDSYFEGIFSGADIGMTVGSSLTYWIEAIDDDGAPNDNFFNKLSFEIVEFVNTDVPLLIVDDGLRIRRDVLRNYLTNSNKAQGVDYAWWNVDDNKGISSYEVNSGSWDKIFVLGWDGDTVPTREYGDDPYSAFIEDGGSFFFADMDYFYHHGENMEPTFSNGDFAYDFLGLAGGFNDVEINPDSVFYGLQDDMISEAFLDTPYRIYPLHFSGNWTDGVISNENALTFFYTAEFEMGSAVRIDNLGSGNKSMYFAFDITSSAVDDSIEVDGEWAHFYGPSDQFTTLMDSVFEYFEIEFVNGIDYNSETLPASIELSQNFPNPFNPSTSISFGIPHTQNVRLEVFNIHGQKVVSLLDGKMNAGEHTVSFKPGNISSGIYFYTLEAGDFKQTMKMLFVK